MNICEYLENTRLSSCCTGNITVVIGNEASDLDSMVSSVTYAYFLFLSGINAVPIMNIPRGDFALRTEAVYLFETASINSDTLLFINDINLEELAQKDILELILVDHNAPGCNLAPYATRVIEILDHHVDEKQYPPDAKVDIRAVGSTATLVGERFIHDRKDSIDSRIGTLLTGTILLDTVNLDKDSGRVTAEDEKVARELLTRANLDQQTLFNKLQFEKFNVSSLGTHDLLRKDFKEWQLGDIKCGISSILMPAIDWVNKSSDLLTVLHACTKERNLDVLLIMHAFTDPEFTRDLGVFIPDSQTRKKTLRFLESSDLALEAMEIGSNRNWDELVYYHQGNSGISRKKLQPKIKDFYTT